MSATEHLAAETPEQRAARLKAFYAKVSANVFSAEGRRVWEGQPDVRVERDDYDGGAWDYATSRGLNSAVRI